MRSIGHTATFSSDLIQLLFRQAFSTGPTREVLDRIGIDASVIQGPQVRISARQFHSLWSAAEAASRDPCFGLHLGELRQLPVGNVLFAVMANSATVGQALSRYCRYHDLMADALQPKLVGREGQAVLGWDDSDVRPTSQQVECVFSLVVSIIRCLTGGVFEGEVRFTHGQPRSVREHNRILGPSVRFDHPRNELLLDEALLATPLLAADAELVPHLEQYVERLRARVSRGAPWSARIAKLLAGQLCDGKPILRDVASRLRMSPRTLQNRLSSEGTSYQEVLDSVRKEMATAYLARSKVTVGELSFLLGFADQSAFCHSFKRWTRTSPERYRAAHQSDVLPRKGRRSIGGRGGFAHIGPPIPKVVG